MITELDVEMMGAAENLRARSDDWSRRVGCVITSPDGEVLAEGWNALPDSVRNLPHRMSRPAKYDFIEHAERWAISQAARDGVALRGSTAYVPWFPCCECARMLTMSGVERVVCREPDFEDPRYGAGFRHAMEIFEDRGVEVSFYPLPDPEPQVRSESPEM